MLLSLQALAKHYPQQIYFPFQLSSLHYGPEGQGRAQQLQPLLQNPLMKEWGAALNDITYPEQRWQGWSARLTSLFAAGKKVSLGLAAAVRLVASRQHVCYIDIAQGFLGLWCSLTATINAGRGRRSVQGSGLPRYDCKSCQRQEQQQNSRSNESSCHSELSLCC